MIPPFLASLGGKVALGVIGAAVLGGAIYAYNARQQSIGENREKAKIFEQIQDQAEHVKAHDEALADSRLEGLERMLAEKDAFNAAMLRENKQLKAKVGKAITKEPEVIHEVDYITVEKPVIQPCLVPDELVDRVDDLARVLNQIPYNYLPGSTEASGERTVSGLPPVACAALVARIETLTSRLGNTLIGYRNISARAVKQYELHERFKKGLTPEGEP